MDIIKEKYAYCAICYRNMRLYFIKDAINIIKDCQIYEIEIMGLDAFILSGKGIQPSLEHSLWFCENSAIDRERQAIEFLSDADNANYLYEVWYDGY